MRETWKTTELLGVPVAAYELGENEVHVWKASLDPPAGIIERLNLLLSEDEHQRSERFYHATDRHQFVAGRGILRRILSAYLELAPDELKFEYNQYGKPFLSPDRGGSKLDFSLSHSNGMALYVVARGRRVGIDIEFAQEDFATLEIAERFFSKEEIESLKAVPITRRTDAFFNCWSRKEAYIKAIGMGVSYPLDGFTVSVDPGTTPALLRVASDASEAARWKMYELEVSNRHAAALIVENPPVSLSLFQASFNPGG
jgi:4'-phosphopantetheinyl transferase